MSILKARPQVINEAGVLARSGPVDAVEPNANVSVRMAVIQEAVPQIQIQRSPSGRPLGVRPEVNVWCTHSRSVGVVFPNTGQGIELASPDKDNLRKLLATLFFTPPLSSLKVYSSTRSCGFDQQTGQFTSFDFRKERLLIFCPLT